MYISRSATFVQYSLSRGSLDFVREDVALVSIETRWHRPVLRGEQTHPFKRGAETGQSSFLVVMPTALLAHPQQHLGGEKRAELSQFMSLVLAGLATLQIDSGRMHRQAGFVFVCIALVLC